MLYWANRFGIFCFLDNHEFRIAPSRYQCLLAAGVRNSVSAGSLEDLEAFLSKRADWCFGHFNYELHSLIHPGSVPEQDPLGFPLFHFFEPEVLIRLDGDLLLVQADDPEKVFEEILNSEAASSIGSIPEISQRLSSSMYMDKILSLKQHIQRGDCYEINFCQEFYAENAVMDPVRVFLQLSHYSPGPFSSLYRYHNSYLVCTSPERFMMKQGNLLISQPMKGTAGRDLHDPQRDEELKEALQHSSKDRSENVMVVDLVRNDLSRVCREGSVQVDELFGVYSYPHVHQMVSTISGQLLKGTGLVDILRACFPMGSMTGAPKVRVMELIDEFEEGPRGIYSGSVGYIDPAGDFDFNVVIRSIMYHSRKKYLSYKVGSGITFYSDPAQEWEECLLKGAALRKVLEGSA